jgi:hypothetical protein
MRIANKLGMAFVMVCLISTQIGLADFAYSQVIIGVATTRSFTVTLNGQGATASNPAMPGTATAVIWFNSTDGQTKNQNATVIGSNPQVGEYPACATPIAAFKNTGNVVENLNIILNNTVTGVVFFYNASAASGSTTGTPNATINSFNGAGSTFVSGLGLNNVTNLCIWVNFTNVAGGQYQTQFNYSSA